MHPRNIHKNGYPIEALCRAYPGLSGYVIDAKSGSKSVDFSNPKAVKALNAALLTHYYHIDRWDIPDGYLCPPVPGRADYIHGIADLLARSSGDVIPIGSEVKGLDIGTGANAIYPIIGTHSYQWRFVGSDIDPISITSAQKIISNNARLSNTFEVRLQKKRDCIFEHIIQSDEHYTFTMCNPPFHKSAKEAHEGTQRKVKNLGVNKAKRGSHQSKKGMQSTGLNFAGQANELWCEGGELAFIQRMIKESVTFKRNVRWFTCLVSKSAHLLPIQTSINYYGASQCHTIDMGQGQKQSRFIAWTFET
ncbi:23S rRNA (adenine(1618)-N(6))-methyltransferase RlmF [Alteromonas sp.]|nr:23S rRNA (adenine(1618)-N(6))-methyltransferase RlmF [Alteromonas sp.]